MARYSQQTYAASLFNVHPATIANWLKAGYITGYRADAKTVLVDLDEIDRALLSNPKMRDKRQPYGPQARIVALPLTVEATGVDQ